LAKNSATRFWTVAGRRLRVVEAMLALAGAALALRLLPFRVIAAWIGQASPGAAMPVDAAVQRPAAPAVAQVRAAMASVERRLDLHDCCLIIALAAGGMLRRRGITSVLHLGVARSATGFEGHAWLEAEGRMVCGGRTVSNFTPIARIVSERRPA
jgi:Transglutaminase-like superfamily